MNAPLPGWLTLHRGDAPLIVSFPHTGTDLPADVAGGFASPWRARRDADWWVHRLYAFARELGATTLRTSVSLRSGAAVFMFSSTLRLVSSVSCSWA